MSRTSCEIWRSITPVAWRPVSDRLLHAEDGCHVAQGSQRVAKLVGERGEEFILQLRFVMQPMLAILDRGTGLFRFIGAPLGLFLRLTQLRFDFLALGDVDEQPLALVGERRFLLLLERDVSKRAEYAGDGAVRISLRVRAVGDVDQPPVLGDDTRLALDLRAGTGAAEGILDIGAIIRVDQGEAGTGLQIVERITEQHLQAARRRIDHDS